MILQVAKRIANIRLTQMRTAIASVSLLQSYCHSQCQSLTIALS